MSSRSVCSFRLIPLGCVLAHFLSELLLQTMKATADHLIMPVGTRLANVQVCLGETVAVAKYEPTGVVQTEDVPNFRLVWRPLEPPQPWLASLLGPVCSDSRCMPVHSQKANGTKCWTRLLAITRTNCTCSRKNPRRITLDLAR